VDVSADPRVPATQCTDVDQWANLETWLLLVTLKAP
jgi:hypothetical protein